MPVLVSLRTRAEVKFYPSIAAIACQLLHLIGAYATCPRPEASAATAKPVAIAKLAVREHVATIIIIIGTVSLLYGEKILFCKNPLIFAMTVMNIQQQLE